MTREYVSVEKKSYEDLLEAVEHIHKKYMMLRELVSYDTLKPVVFKETPKCPHCGEPIEIVKG